MVSPNAAAQRFFSLASRREASFRMPTKVGRICSSLLRADGGCTNVACLSINASTVAARTRSAVAEGVAANELEEACCWPTFPAVFDIAVCSLPGGVRRREEEVAPEVVPSVPPARPVPTPRSSRRSKCKKLVFSTMFATSAEVAMDPRYPKILIRSDVTLAEVEPAAEEPADVEPVFL